MAVNARELARAIVAAPGEPLQTWLSGADAPSPAELGWALKYDCYEAWSTEPSRSRLAARRLQELAEGCGDGDGAAELQALASWTRGIALLCEGRMADAADSLDAAHARFSALADQQHAAETRVPKVMALSMLGRDEDALACAHEALAQFMAAGDERSAGKVELNLGTMLSRQDRHAEAADRFRRAAVRFARVGDTEHSVMADIGLANALTWQFDADEALRVNERARMRAAAHGFHVLGALAQGAIGRIELHRGRYHRALPALAAACAMLEKSGASPLRCIEAESALADGYLAVNMLPEALAVYEQVIQRARSMQAPTEMSRAILDRARALERSGAIQPALLGLSEARRMFGEQGNASSVAFTDLCIAEAQLKAGEPEVAALNAASAIQGLKDTGMRGWRLQAQAAAAAADAAMRNNEAANEAFETTLADARGLLHVELSCHLGLGALAWRAGDAARARDHLVQAVGAVDDARATLPGDLFRTGIAMQVEQAHDLLIEIALDTREPSTALLEQTERGRARAFAIAHQEGESTPGEGTVKAHARLQWARERWRQALAEGEDDPQALAARAADVNRREAELLETHRRELLAGATDAACPSPRTDRFSVERLQATLEADQVMVVFHRLGDRLVACVIDRDEVTHLETPCAGLDERLQGLRFQIDALRFDGPALHAHTALLDRRVRVHLQALHDMVWAPVAPRVVGSRQVVVVPHRELHYLPFCALHDGRQFLVHHHEISIAPSASLWLACAARPASWFDRMLALGIAGAALPHVQRELDAVAAVYGPGARVLREAEATQHALRTEVATADVLHLACHGEFRADSPLFSSLDLADGPLTLHDAQSLALSTSLVTLSACETGMSHVAPGDELLGMVRGFLVAGTPAVLASQWTVDDGHTATLMQHFYEHLVAGARPAAALRYAQLVLVREGLHPYFWAAFALHGRG